MRCNSLHFSRADCTVHIPGFFFGLRRSIVRAACNASAAQLFDPANRIIGQEGDLFSRMANAVRLQKPSSMREHSAVSCRMPRAKNVPASLLKHTDDRSLQTGP